MDMKRCSVALAWGWGVTALGLALAGFPGTSRAVIPLLVAATVVGSGAAFAAALAFRDDRRYLAGMLLILSAFTPTNGAVLLNSGALILGFVVAVRGTRRARSTPLVHS